MNQDRYIFSQIMDFISQYEFDKCVEKYKGNRKIYRLTCRDQFLSLVFGQLTGLKSLRGIILCLNAHLLLNSAFLITKAKMHDSHFLDVLEFEAGAFYILDRGYLDFERL